MARRPSRRTGSANSAASRARVRNFVVLASGITPPTIPAPVFTIAASIQHDGTPAVGEQLVGVDGVANYPIVSRRWLLGSTVLATVNAFTPSQAGRYAFESLTRAPDGREQSSRAEVDVAAATVTPTPTPVPGARTMQIGANQDGPNHYAADHFFVDRAKLMDRWASFRRTDNVRLYCDTIPEFTFDSNGWPQNIPSTFRQIQVYVQGHRLVEGVLNRYYIEWENASGVGVGGSVQNATANSATLVPNQDNSGFFAVSFDAISPGFRFKICREDQKPLLQAGTLLNPESTAKWAAYSGPMRVMNWGPTNGSSLSKWVDRPLMQHSSFANGGVPGGAVLPSIGQRGIPLEVMVAAANAAGRGLWYCFPALADDDFVERALTYFATNLSGPLTLELSNEVWNSGLFQAYGQYQALADALLGPNIWTGLQYHGYRSAIVAKRAIEVYTQAGRRFDVYNVLGRQSAFPDGTVENDRFITWGGGKPVSTYPSSTSVGAVALPATGAQRISDYFDAYAIAPYCGGMLNLPPSGAYTPKQREFVLGCIRDGEAGYARAFRQWEYGDQDLGFTGGPSTGRPATLGLDETLPGIYDQIVRWRQKCDAEGLGLVAYEENLIVQSYRSAWGSDTEEVAAWTIALHVRPEMEELMLKYLRLQAAAGMERVCIYKHVNYATGGGDLSGFAGMLMWETQADTPRYKALKTLKTTPAPVTLNVPALAVSADTFTATVGSSPRRRFTVTGGRAPRHVRPKAGSAMPASRSIALRNETGTFATEGTGQSYTAEVIDADGTTVELVVSQNVKAAGQGFTPASIATRCWIDPSDLATLFQDNAGTVPVTAAGQPVLRLNDKSGNGKHLVAAGGTPTLTINNGIYRLEVPKGVSFTFVSEPDVSGLTSTFLGLTRKAGKLVMWSKGVGAFWGVTDSIGTASANGVGSGWVDRTTTTIDYRPLTLRQRDRLAARVAPGEPVIVEASDLAIPSGTGLKVFGYGGFDDSESFYGLIITSKSVADQPMARYDIFSWMAAKTGQPI